MRTLFALIAAATTAAAQQPYGVPQPYGPNVYNRQTQPLSPYLNLLRGSNPATNYYYGVRPGLPGGQSPFGRLPGNGTTLSGFQPILPQDADPSTGGYEPGGREIRLRPAGHPVTYGNTFAGHGSYFNVYAPNVRQTGTGGQAGANRPGGGGFGTPPKTTTAPPRR